MYPVIEIAGIKLNTFPLFAFFAIAVCSIIFSFGKKHSHVVQHEFYKVCFPTILSGIAGGRILSAISLTVQGQGSFFYNIVHGGAVFYGGMLGAMIGLVFACYYQNKILLFYSDILATFLPLAQAIGRIGCYCNGCCYGKPYKGCLSVKFLVEGRIVEVFPTWFFESFFCLSLFIALYFLMKTCRIGVKTSVYLIAYSVFRFCIEFMRGDEIRGFIGVLSLSQVISCFVIVMTVFVMVACHLNKDLCYVFYKKET